MKTSNPPNSAKTLFNFKPLASDHKPYDLSQFKGKAFLIVNVASKCGFTPQYKGLESLYQKFHDKGLMILGFPCNQFGFQEPGSDEEIQSFCKMTYDVSFPVLAKVDVNGDKADPLYQWLKESAPGLLGTEAIKWNFTKFLVNKEGHVVERFAPNVEPSSMTSAIEKLL